MPHAIYAEPSPECAGEKWRPSNGTEGDIFIESWCCECAHDANGDCPIVANTFCYTVDDPRYPAEWRYSQEGQPECAAFTAMESKQ